MNKAISLEERFSRFTETWSPQIVAELNGQQVKLFKLEGDRCPWHSHANEDEMFLLIDGTIEIHLRDGVIAVGPGEFHIVRKGVEHRVVPRGRACGLLFEPATTAHTGAVQAEITRREFGRLTD